MNIRTYLTLKNVLIAAVLIAIYVVLLRWDEAHCDPPGTFFTIIPAMCPESSSMPLALEPVMFMSFITGLGFILFVGGRGLLRSATQIFRRGNK